MRTFIRSEICRDLAYSLLRTKKEGLRLSDYFDECEQIVIYGAGQIGRSLCDMLQSEGKVVKFFIDVHYCNETHDDVPIVRPDNECVHERLCEERAVVVVTPVYAWDDIVEGFREIFAEDIRARVIPVNLLFVYAERQLTKKQMSPAVMKLHDDLLLMDISAVSNIIVTQTPYNLLLCLLVNKEWQKAIFVFGKALSDDFCERLSDMNMAAIRVRANDMDDDNQRMVEFLRLLGFLTALEGKTVWGLDHVFPGRFLFGGDFHVVEDGDFNYDPMFCQQNSFDCEDHDREQLLRADQGRRYIVGGYDEAVKEVFLTRENEVPDFLKKKTRIFSIADKWNEKSDEEKIKILKVFGIDEELLLNIRKRAPEIVFLSSPFYENRDLTRDEEIELYKKVLERYDSKKVIIKPHPRDTTDYSLSFSEYYVLPQMIPIEMLDLLGISIKIMAGFSTTAFSYAEKAGYAIHNYTMYGERDYG